MNQTMHKYRQAAERGRQDELILSHLALVKHVVGRLLAEVPPGTDVENLEGAGVLGLVEAAAKFDPTMNVQFKTFAYARIRGAILDEVRRNCPLPQEVMRKVTQVRQAYARLTGGNGPGTVARSLKVADLARATGLSEDEVTDVLTAMRLIRISSWEQAVASRGSELVDPADGPEAGLEKAEQIDLLAEALAELPERDRLVVTLYYREGLRLKEIKEVVNLSESRISRLLNKALFELGELLRARGYDPGPAGEWTAELAIATGG